MISESHMSSKQSNIVTNPKEYSFLVGALQYVTITVHDTAFSVNKVSQLMHCPLYTYLKAIIRILRYLKGTFTYRMTIKYLLYLSFVGFLGNTDTDMNTVLTRETIIF